MKCKYFYLSCIFMSLLFLTSCDNNSGEEPEIPDPPSTIPDKVRLYFRDNKEKTFLGTYEGVRIGEYYWMNSNFKTPFENDITREQIDKILLVYDINPDDYPITTEEFNEYFGQHYSRNYIEDMVEYGRLYENQDTLATLGWGLPTPQDFQQLFGMCGRSNCQDVIKFLCYKHNEVPVAINVSGWFSRLNANTYGFNMTPSGWRYHGDDPYEISIWLEDGSQKNHIVHKGDLVNFMQVASFVGSGGTTITIHDYPDTTGGKLFYWMNMRWCRKLTDEELGYRLYIDSQQTDIQKLGLTDSRPTGYNELPNGYIRGFYVQYILDNPRPEKTVAEIVQMAQGLR